MNMRFKGVQIFLFVLLVGLTPAFGQMGQMGHDQEMKMKNDDKTEKYEEHGMGMEIPRWKKSLTEEQKAKTDKMHLELKKVMSLLESKVSMKEAELNSLVTQDKPDANAIHNKINEIMEQEKEIMVKKYDHISEMRSILTPEQRVSFDLGLLGHHEEHH
jgi:Spy/CpxP family protein refolding chaperone